MADEFFFVGALRGSAFALRASADLPARARSAKAGQAGATSFYISKFQL